MRSSNTKKSELTPTVVHAGTQIQTIFAVVKDGNLEPSQPFQVNVSVFSKEEFSKAFDLILEAKQKYIDSLETDAAVVTNTT